LGGIDAEAAGELAEEDAAAEEEVVEGEAEMFDVEAEEGGAA
jgi:hypothetical protein